jgi:site-specific DNA-cytosine methylase
MNAFDNGDIRTTILITTANVIGTLQARDYKGVGNQYVAEDKLIIEESITIFSHTQGLDAQPSETLSPTLRAGGAGMAVTYSPSGFADYSEGMGTLKAGMTNNNSPLVAVDEYNGSTDETHHTLRANKHSTGVMNDMTVRRLTPVECERLQGFPDNWTEGQSDSARYKQMGNAVAVPVVEWIIGNICDTLKEAE